MNDIVLLESFKESECYLYWIYSKDLTDPFRERLYWNIY